MTDIISGKSEEHKIPDWLPIVPLHNAVLFPGATAPITVTNRDAVRAVETASTGERIFAAISISREPDKSDKANYDYLYRTGTVALILRMIHEEGQGTQLVVQGLHKIRIERFKVTDKVPYAKVKVVREPLESTPNIQALTRRVTEKAEELIQKAPMIPDELQGMPSSVKNPHRLAYMVLTVTRADMHLMQKIYETKSLEKKLRLTFKELTHELQIVDLGGKIQNEIQTKISKTERDFYLREQMEAIRKELGETGDEQIETKELREKIDRTLLPAHVLEKADKELKRLNRLPPSSPEYPMSRNYLDWLIEFPWLKRSQDKLDIRRAAKVLNEDHYNLKPIKDRILEFLAVRKLNPDIKGPILCFIGPPGVGKTSLGQSIARAMGREFVRLSLGGVRDEAEIRGHRRTYIGALPGTIVQHIKRSGTSNPVFMLDEIDKVGQDFRGDPSSALLEVLDPEQNHSFRDHYIELDIDLSKVLFIATANTPDPIQPALRDRMEEIRLAGYTTREKEQIAMTYLIPRSIENNGLSARDAVFSKKGLEFLIAGYTREAGVRNLEREIQSICRKIAVRKTRGSWKKRKITPELISRFLGAERYTKEVKRRTAIPGVATGLAWTSVGGEILFIEALPIRGDKGIILTGKLGDVMKESARAALSLIRSRTKELDIPSDFFSENEIHLHVPAGAVPKDGPSAGITMAVALASAATGMPVRNDLAMTGEITLSGQVLPIGGVKEKVIAAHRAGIKNVILPTRNQKDLEEIDKAIKNDVSFTFVGTIDDVLKEGLKKNSRPKRIRNGKHPSARK